MCVAAVQAAAWNTLGGLTTGSITRPLNSVTATTGNSLRKVVQDVSQLTNVGACRPCSAAQHLVVWVLSAERCMCAWKLEKCLRQSAPLSFSVQPEETTVCMQRSIVRASRRH